MGSVRAKERDNSGRVVGGGVPKVSSLGLRLGTRARSFCISALTLWWVVAYCVFISNCDGALENWGRNCGWREERTSWLRVSSTASMLRSLRRNQQRSSLDLMFTFGGMTTLDRNRWAGQHWWRMGEAGEISREGTCKARARGHASKAPLLTLSSGCFVLRRSPALSFISLPPYPYILLSSFSPHHVSLRLVLGCSLFPGYVFLCPSVASACKWMLI